MLTRLIAAALAVVVLAPLYPLHAQDWPARTITMVVPFPAGGPLDVVARILAQPMGDLLGQQARVGAGGQGHDLEGVGMGGEDVDRLPADRARRAEQRDPAAGLPSPTAVSG